MKNNNIKNMEKLYNKLKKYNLEDAIKIEKTDRQFLALEKLYKNKALDNKNYLFLIIVNALICYQLS
jgi:N-glycosylase/DNA lyase